MDRYRHLVVWILAGLLMVACALLAYVGWWRSPATSGGPGAYTAFFMTNGQIFFGQVVDRQTRDWRIRDVYYIQARMNPDTKQQSNILVRRGREWHGPSEMSLNHDHVLWSEPVGEQSEVARLIAKEKAENK